MPERMKRPLSERARSLIDGGSLPAYLEEHVGRTTGAIPIGGYTCLAIAENKLMWDVLDDKVNTARDVPPSAMGYDDWRGSAALRNALARFVGTRLHNHPVHPDTVQVMAGAGPLVEALTWALCDPGSGVLVPTPSYAGYWFDIGGRNRVTVVPAHTRADDAFELTDAVLDEAWASSEVPIQMLLFTNPSNPLGRIYSDDEIHTVIGWARAKGIPVIVNEIYGLSTYGDTPFRSAALLGYADADDVHFLWAVSKDFAASGLRCGVLITRHEGIRTAFRRLGYFHGVSGDTQHLIATMLDDDPWADGYLATLRKRLRESASTAEALFEGAGAPVVPHDAGIFFVVDLRDFLDEPTWDAEGRLWARLIAETEVNLTPGSACHNGEPGFFRVCYASQPIEVMGEAVARVTTALSP